MIDFRDPLQTLAYALGIPIYVDDAGRVTQHGPGRRIDPPPNSGPQVTAPTLEKPADAPA